jgi:hypothetical protein
MINLLGGKQLLAVFSSKSRKAFKKRAKNFLQLPAGLCFMYFYHKFNLIYLTQSFELSVRGNGELNSRNIPKLRVQRHQIGKIWLSLVIKIVWTKIKFPSKIFEGNWLKKVLKLSPLAQKRHKKNSKGTKMLILVLRKFSLLRVFLNKYRAQI